MVKQNELNHEQRSEVMQQMLVNMKDNGKIKHGLMQELAAKYNVSKRTISRIYGRIKEQRANNITPINVRSKRYAMKPRPSIPFDDNMFKSIEKTKKQNQHAIAKAMNVSQSTVFRWKKRGIIRKHTNAIKPLLNEQNKIDRLIFCIASCSIDEDGNNFTFTDMSNIVHIDEKLFYLTRTQQTYYLAPGEVEPHREIQSKRFIPKVMFMCAVAKPMYSKEGELIFDGKIGIFPFTHEVPAQRSSKNRKRGELETKPIQSITKEHTRDMIISKILPAIRRKWPEGASKTIYIQQDNAKPHILDDDLQFREAANIDGFEFKLVQQPPNSPDMNVLDLGFFRSIQSLQHQQAAYNYTQLVNAVNNAFEALQPSTMKFVWVTLQTCKIEVIQKLGGIDYHIPHMNKTKLAREGKLPDYLTIPKHSIYNALRYLDKKVTKDTFDVLLFYLGIQDEIHFHAYEDINTDSNEEPTPQQQPAANEEPTTQVETEKTDAATQIVPATAI